MDEDELPARAAAMGGRFLAGLQRLVVRGLAVTARGRGLLLALELTVDAAPVVDACREQGLLVNAVQPKALRFAPPLIVEAAQIDHALAILERVLAERVLAPDAAPTPAPA
jgi:acetylornithine/succinyldiaminopimelate/putrescine aminotransferase